MLSDQELLQWLKITLPQGFSIEQKEEVHSSWVRGLAGTKEIPSGVFRNALRQHVFEALEILEHCNPEYIESIEKSLSEAGLPSIGAIAHLKHNKLKKILKTGKIRNDDEFRALLDIVENQANGVDENTKARVNTMLGEYDPSP